MRKEWYEKACFFAGKYLKFKIKVKKEFYEYTNFTGLNVKGEDAFALAIGSAALIGLLFITLAFFFKNVIIMAFILPLCVFYYLGNFPKIYARAYKAKAFPTMPDLINHMAISLKTVPNLEKALEFAASRTRGQMGKEAKRIVWETHMRVYKSMDEALAHLAEKWKKWNENFASSIYLLKGSLLERSEKNRLNAIDKSVDVIFKGTIEKMEAFVRELGPPTLTLYFIGVILPLAILAVLPTLSYVGLNVGAGQLFLFYNIILPIGVYAWSCNILDRRPVTLLPPFIEEKDNKFHYISLVGFLICLPAIFGVPDFFGLDKAMFILWGSSIGISSYLLLKNIEKTKLRDATKEMEEEFVDALNQLGNRVVEGRPIEDAFYHVGKVMKGSKIGKVFVQTANNVIIGRKTLRSALFGDEGSLRNVYSETIKSTMEMVLEATKKGSSKAGEMIRKMAEHLSKTREIDKLIENKLHDVLSSIRSTVLIFAPFVGGVVVSLQQLMSSKILEGQIYGIELFVPQLRQPPIIPEPIPLGTLQLIVGFYIMETAIIFSNFISELYAGEDKIFKSMEIGKNLVSSIILFSLAILISNAFFPQ